MYVDTLINAYCDSKNKVDNLSNILKELRDKIVNEMNVRGIKECVTENSKAVLSVRESVSYDNEAVEILKKLLPESVTEKPNNKEIKAMIKDKKLDEMKIIEYKVESVSKAILKKEVKKS